MELNTTAHVLATEVFSFINRTNHDLLSSCTNPEHVRSCHLLAAFHSVSSGMPSPLLQYPVANKISLVAWLIRLSPTDLTQIQDVFLCLGLARIKSHAPKPSSFQLQTQKRIALAKPPSAEQILPVPSSHRVVSLHRRRPRQPPRYATDHHPPSWLLVGLPRRGLPSSLLWRNVASKVWISASDSLPCAASLQDPTSAGEQLPQTALLITSGRGAIPDLAR